MTRFGKGAIALSASLLLSGSALAAEATDDLGVTLTVEAQCSVVANPLDFGTANFASDLDGATTLAVTCTDDAAYTVSLDAGDGVGATTAVRKLTSGSNTVNYALYKDAGRTEVFGASGGDTLAGTGTGAAQTVNVYGRVPSGQSVPAGSYADTVTVTLTYGL